MASPFAKALQRCVMFGVVQRLSDVLGRPPTGPADLPAPPAAPAAELQSAHEQWTTTTIRLDALARAHALAAAMLAAGDDRGLLEPQLVAVGVPAPAAAEACELLRRPGGSTTPQLAKFIARSTSRRVPNPVAPFERHDSSASTFIGPAMSRWAHGTSPTNSDRNTAAVIAPP